MKATKQAAYTIANVAIRLCLHPMKNTTQAVAGQVSGRPSRQRTLKKIEIKHTVCYALRLFAQSAIVT